MKAIDEYFRKFTDKISFIELKQDSNIKVINKEVPYPIYTGQLVDGITSGEFNEGVSFEAIARGMIITVAIDPEFKYAEYYTKLLSEIPKIKEFILSEGIKYLQSNNEIAIYYFRYMYLENLSTSFSNYNYARLLYNEYELEKVDILRVESIRILEEIIKNDESFPLSYYELGIINHKEKYYNKSYSYFKNALNRTEDELVLEEIREYMREVEPNAKIELGIDSINRGDYENAYKLFMESKILDDSNLANYYLGLISQLTGEFDLGIEYYLKAIDKGAKFKEVYQNLSLLYYQIGELGKAIDVLNAGLAENYEDSVLLYNRVVINLELGFVDKAKEDIDTLLMYGDIEEEILQNITRIKHNYNI